MSPRCKYELCRDSRVSEEECMSLFLSLRARTSRANPVIARNSISVMYRKAVDTSLSTSFRLRTRCRNQPCEPRKCR